MQIVVGSFDVKPIGGRFPEVERRLEERRKAGVAWVEYLSILDHPKKNVAFLVVMSFFLSFFLSLYGICSSVVVRIHSSWIFWTSPKPPLRSSQERHLKKVGEEPTVPGTPDLGILSGSVEDATQARGWVMIGRMFS